MRRDRYGRRAAPAPITVLQRGLLLRLRIEAARAGWSPRDIGDSSLDTMTLHAASVEIGRLRRARDNGWTKEATC